METEMRCPYCFGTDIKKNGQNTTKKKQRYKCKACKKSFAVKGLNWFVDETKRQYIDNMLKERISLRGICRCMGISLSWLMSYVKYLYSKLPNNLNFLDYKFPSDSIVRPEIEIDEMWSFVGDKKNKQWIWIALCRRTRQVVAFHVGDRGETGARELWKKIPQRLRKKAIFHTDDWAAYKKVLPQKRHRYLKIKKETNHIERFNNTVRQRASRLVRLTLSFSKSQRNHIGAIMYFFCSYNLERQALTALTL